MLVNMSIDKNTLNRIIYIHKNQGQLNTLNQSRIFEKGNHELKELSDVKFTSIETKDFLKRSNKYNDFFRAQREGGGSASEDIYPTIISSHLYFLLLNFVKIPTKRNDNVEKTFLHVCNIKFKQPDEMSSNNLKAFNFLCFIRVVDGRDIILEDSIFSYLVENHSDVLDIQEKSSTEINCKKATLDKIENTNDIMGLTYQQNFKTRCKEILNFKSTHEETGEDTSEDNDRLDNLQLHMIEQQLRFGMYLALKPVLVLSYLKFNRFKSMIDQTGNLFFSLSLPTKSLNKTDLLDFSDVLMQIMDYGFYISYPNMVEKVSFSKDCSEQSPKQFHDSSFSEREGLGGSIGRNELYTLLFRLLDPGMSVILEKIDDLVLNKKHDEFHLEITKLLI